MLPAMCCATPGDTACTTGHWRTTCAHWGLHVCPLKLGMAQQSLLSPRAVAPVSLAEHAGHSSLPVFQTPDTGIILKVSFDQGTTKHHLPMVCLGPCYQHGPLTGRIPLNQVSRSPGCTSIPHPLCRSPSHQGLCISCGSNSMSSTCLHRCWRHFPTESNQ